MSGQYNILLHEIVNQQIDEVIGKDKKLKKKYEKAISKCSVNPTAVGGRMKGVVCKDLEGKIYKVHVSNPKEHRLVYFILEKVKAVFPILLSPDIKSRFSYDDYDWEGIAETILTDFTENNYPKFIKYIF